MVNDIEFYDVDNSCVKTAIAPFRIDLDVPYGEKKPQRQLACSGTAETRHGLFHLECSFLNVLNGYKTKLYFHDNIML